MKLSPTRVRRQRAQLDLRIAKIRPLAAEASAPRMGWIRSIREALGMSASQLAARMGITMQSVRKLEDGEADKRITLATLERAAQALGGRLVYFVVPDEALEVRVDARARAVARKRLARVRHSMALEAQEPPPALHEMQVAELAAELKAKRSRELWDEP